MTTAGWGLSELRKRGTVPDTAQQTLLHDHLSKTEQKALRYRLLHVAARLTRGQRRTWLRIQRSWARDLAAAFIRLAALPVPAD